MENVAIIGKAASSPASPSPDACKQRASGSRWMAGAGAWTISFLLIHESPLTDALFLLVSKSDEVTTT